MHIGLFSPIWPPGASANGIVTYVGAMRHALAKSGHRVDIITHEGVFNARDVCTSPFAHGKSMLERAIDRLGRLWPFADAAARYGRKLARSIGQAHAADPFDVVEMEESFGWSFHVQRRLDCLVVTRLHGPNFLGQLEQLTGAAARQSHLRDRAERRAIESADALTAPSRATLARTLERYRGRSLSAVIANPIEPVAQEAMWALDRCDEHEILCVGRFDRRKGADICLAAFLLAAERDPGLTLVFIGPDPGLQINGEYYHFDDYLRSNFDEELRGKIEFRGRVDPEDIATARQHAFATLVCSRYESFSYAAAEGMAVGTPLIVTNGVDLIEDGESGLVVPSEDAEATAEAIIRLRADPAAAAAMGAAARRRCASLYNGDLVASQTVEFYRQAIALRRDRATPAAG